MDIKKLTPLFEGKRCVILGFGREGKVWLDLLTKLSCCKEIAVADMNPVEIDNPDIVTHCGEHYLEECENYDLILQSPGVVIKNNLSAAAKAKILTQTEVLLRLGKDGCLKHIIGITGTKGKSTASSLVYHFLQSCNIPSILIGNIGIPPLQRIEEFDENLTVVCEMSCHQLEFVKHSPDISVLLNIYPEHLDHYTDLNAYAQTKRNIARYQTSGCHTLANIDILPIECGGTLCTTAFGKSADVWTDGSSLFLFGKEIPCECVKTKLCGKHNLYNIAVALAAANFAGADINTCLEHLCEFEGLKHRLERINNIDGVEYINDSISTIPEAAIAAVKAFDDTDCIILGGMDRGISYDILGDFLNTGVVKNVILLPDSGLRIGKLITNPEVSLYYAKDLKDAVLHSIGCARHRVLFSPASASYGFYKNFEERGDHFKKIVSGYRGFYERMTM